MRFKFLIAGLALVGILWLVGCPTKNNYHINNNRIEQAANPNILTDATGMTFTIPAEYSRIISLDPYLTENVKILQSESKLVGRTDFCQVTREIPSVGNILDPSIEKIVSLKPDLVLASQEGNRPNSIERLRELRIPAFVFGESNSWSKVKNGFLELGKLLNQSARAEEVINQILQEIAVLNAKEEEQKIISGNASTRPKIFVQLNVKPLMTAGHNTFINEIVTMSGGYNIAQDSILPWPTMNEEEIIRINPDIIIVCDMGNLTAAAKALWAEPKFANLAAVKNKQVQVMDSNLLCQPTPINFINAVKKIREYLKY